MTHSDKILQLAIFMYEKYEMFSTEAGWDAQEKCKTDFGNLPEKNQTVMLKVAEAVLKYVD